MSVIRSDIPKALPVFSIVYTESLEDQLEDVLSPLVSKYEAFKPSFNPSLSYYAKEMKGGLKRIIIYSDQVLERDCLIRLKLKAVEIENSFAIDGKRQINIDPAILTLEQFVLSTGKPYNHRIYLGEGVFTDLTLIFANKTFCGLDWSYPDYLHPEKISFFNNLRKRFKQDLIWNAV